MAETLINIHPVPSCCGAAVLTDFGSDYTAYTSPEKFAQVEERFNKVINDFENTRGEFRPFGEFEDYVDHARARAYYQRGRSGLVIYLNALQVGHFREMVEKRGFQEVFTFKNHNSGVNVTMFVLDRGDW